MIFSLKKVMAFRPAGRDGVRVWLGVHSFQV